ncbi:hypothetical protein GCM10023093_26260 [Nemorincola caseinilytica]|uniref:Uncharacterized protein n=1 Tax=Nemorincola caseinilytica TaxID=2054315 RepID=A0ABP8NNS5_9BACT
MSHLRQTRIPVALGILGASLLFYVSILLIVGSRLAIAAVNEEMSYSRQFFKRHFTDEQGVRRGSLWQQMSELLRRSLSQKKTIQKETPTEQK